MPDVYINLISPNGIVSPICTGRPLDEEKDGFQGYQFMSVAHWDEEVIGDWTVAVSDHSHPEAIGTFKAASMRFYGSLKPGMVPPVDTTSKSTPTKSGALSAAIGFGLTFIGLLVF
ncbi:pheromone processing endoprotease [Rhizoclosmatium sp. JEL0117]|nr:pheromone processing endoprotease [Rhizoclosmatium sp. JEL0117]